MIKKGNSIKPASGLKTFLILHNIPGPFGVIIKNKPIKKL